MYKNLNPRTMGLNHHPYETLLAAAHQHGFEGIEVPSHAFGSVEAAKEAGKKLGSMGMRWGLMMTPCDLFLVDDTQFEVGLKQWARWLERARAAGCHRAYNHVWPGSDHRDYDENFEWHRKRLIQIHHIMKENGYQYGLEFMGAQTVCDCFRHPFARTISETMELANSVSHDIGFVFDTIHWYTSGATKDDLYLFLKHRDRVINLHLNDAYLGRTAKEQIDKERAMPNESGIIDCVPIIRAFHESGYDGPVMVEPMAPSTIRYGTMKPETVAQEASLCLDNIMREAGVFV